MHADLGRKRPAERIRHDVDARLGAAVGDMFEPMPVKAAIDETLTIRPSPLAFSAGAKARIVAKTPRQLLTKISVDQRVRQGVEIAMRDRFRDAGRVDENVHLGQASPAPHSRNASIARRHLDRDRQRRHGPRRQGGSDDFLGLLPTAVAVADDDTAAPAAASISAQASRPMPPEPPTIDGHLARQAVDGHMCAAKAQLFFPEIGGTGIVGVTSHQLEIVVAGEEGQARDTG
jgi:hypothetical protein